MVRSPDSGDKGLRIVENVIIEWVSIIIRWVHVVAGIAWIGSSFYFIHLDLSLKPNGALWVIRPKGRPEISERAVMAAGKAAGLVDVKVVGFSPTHTAEKFVIPVSGRG